MSESRFGDDAGDDIDIRTHISEALEQSEGGGDGSSSERSPPPAAAAESTGPREPAVDAKRPALPLAPRPQDGASAAAGEAPAGEVPAGGERPATGGRAAAAADEASPPQHWSAEDKALLNELPSPARANFMRLYKRMEGGYQPKLQRASSLEKDYGPLDQVFNAETRQFLQRIGVAAPHQIIQRWAGAERALLGDQSRDMMFAHLIQAYRGNPAQIARHLNELHRSQGGGTVPANGQGAGAVPDVIDTRLRAIEGRFAAAEQSQNMVALDTAQRRVETFMNATGADGVPLHPHFAQLEHVMTLFATNDLREGKTPDLEDLYQRAAWAHPEIRGEMQQAEFTRRDRDVAAGRRARSEAARRAGSSVNGSPTGSGWSDSVANGLDRSIRDNIVDAVGNTDRRY